MRRFEKAIFEEIVESFKDHIRALKGLPNPDSALDYLAQEAIENGIGRIENGVLHGQLCELYCHLYDEMISPETS